MANLPRRSISILCKTRLFHTLTSLPLGFNTKASLTPTLKCQSKGVLDRISHDPTNTLHQQKPYIPLELTIHKVISLRMYLTTPGSDWGSTYGFLLGSWYPEELPESPASVILSPKRSEYYLCTNHSSRLFFFPHYVTLLV